MKNVNKTIYEGRVTQQVPSYVYENYVDEGLISLDTGMIFTIMASKSENYEFVKTVLHDKYGRRVIDKAYRELKALGHLLQVNYNVREGNQTKTKSITKFFVEARSSAEVKVIVSDIIKGKLSQFPSAKPTKDTLAYINKGVKIERDFKVARKRIEMKESGGMVIQQDNRQLIECKEIKHVSSDKIFFAPKEEIIEDGFLQIDRVGNLTDDEETEDYSFLLEGIANIDGVKDKAEFNSIQEGFAHDKQGKVVLRDSDEKQTNKANISSIAYEKTYYTKDFGQVEEVKVQLHDKSVEMFTPSRIIRKGVVLDLLQEYNEGQAKEFKRNGHQLTMDEIESLALFANMKFAKSEESRKKIQSAMEDNLIIFIDGKYKRVA
ncbi:hypothetical protein IE3_03360 [Bacillus cereus BAG3X2-1]|nr:hypothetical protein IE3_03360 [Bacillus cereus BAG3X2-1]